MTCAEAERRKFLTRRVAHPILIVDVDCGSATGLSHDRVLFDGRSFCWGVGAQSATTATWPQTSRNASG